LRAADLIGMLRERVAHPPECMRESSPQPRYTLLHTDRHAERSGFAEEVARGLLRRHKAIPCRFLYDEVGSQLFEEICEVPEYYLTRTERRILAQRADEVAARVAGPIALAELGSGSAAKTRLLIEAFLRAHGRLRYVPVDISRSVLEESALALLERYQGLEITAIASEYAEGLRHVRAHGGRPKLVAWLGSSIGNLRREEASAFLRSVRAALAPADRLLLGVDLRKSKAVLEAAYDDAAGVTARFTLNLLARANRELGAAFPLDAFRHHAVYHETEGRVEIRLVSLRRQRVALGTLGFAASFEAGEGLHVEDCFKYSLAEIEALARSAALAVERQWLDAEGRFSVNLLAPAD
jgi:dimethylhistidine N-methyltransferase